MAYCACRLGEGRVDTGVRIEPEQVERLHTLDDYVADRIMSVAAADALQNAVTYRLSAAMARVVDARSAAGIAKMVPGDLMGDRAKHQMIAL
jgi:hypothetical protein